MTAYMWLSFYIYPAMEVKTTLHNILFVICSTLAIAVAVSSPGFVEKISQASDSSSQVDVPDMPADFFDLLKKTNDLY